MTDQITTAARMAGDWWAGHLADKYVDKRDAFAQAVASRVEQALRGEITWRTVPDETRPGVWVNRRFAGDGKPLRSLNTEFDYDPDPLLREALLESVDPDARIWTLKSDFLPIKHSLLVCPDRLIPKAGYGNFMPDIPVVTND